jgi:uncharacterized protein (UPF0335 family)
MVIKINFIRKKDLLKRIEVLEEELKTIKNQSELTKKITEESKEVYKQMLEYQREQKEIFKEWLTGEEKK